MTRTKPEEEVDQVLDAKLKASEDEKVTMMPSLEQEVFVTNDEWSKTTDSYIIVVEREA